MRRGQLLATLELEASNVDAARAVLDTLLEASPGDVESLVLRGVVSHLLGEIAEAKIAQPSPCPNWSTSMVTATEMATAKAKATTVARRPN